MADEQKRIDIINFLAPVNDHTISHLIDVAYTAHAEGSSEIHLYISSTGGRLNPAFTAYNFFRSLHMPFYTHNIGCVETAGLPLYLASNHRSTSQHSKFFFYGFEWTFYRDHIRFPEIIEAHSSLQYDAEHYEAIFKERTNGSFDIRSCLVGPAQALSPQQAIDAGIVTAQQLTPPEIPELAKLWLVHS